MGHKGPVLRPSCTGTGRARTQIPFNSIQIHAHTKQQATHSTKDMETGYCCRGIWWRIWGPERKISQQTTPFSRSVCKITPSGGAWCRCFKNLLMPSYGQTILLTQVADTDYLYGFSQSLQINTEAAPRIRTRTLLSTFFHIYYSFLPIPYTVD